MFKYNLFYYFKFILLFFTNIFKKLYYNILCEIFKKSFSIYISNVIFKILIKKMHKLYKMRFYLIILINAINNFFNFYVYFIQISII